MLDGSGTGVSPVCWLHDSRGRDARAWGLDISLNDLGNWARRWRLGLFLGPLTWGVAPGWYGAGLWPASLPATDAPGQCA